MGWSWRLLTVAGFLPLLACAVGPDVNVELVPHDEHPGAVHARHRADPATATRTRAQAPLRLVTRSGDALPMGRLQVRVFDDDPVLFAELDMSFEHRPARATSGTLEIELPRGARVVRFALRDPEANRWKEAEIVPRPSPELHANLYAATPSAIAPAADPARFVAELPQIPGQGELRAVLSYVIERTEPGLGSRLPLAGITP